MDLASTDMNADSALTRILGSSYYTYTAGTHVKPPGPSCLSSPTTAFPIFIKFVGSFAEYFCNYTFPQCITLVMLLLLWSNWARPTYLLK